MTLVLYLKSHHQYPKFSRFSLMLSSRSWMSVCSSPICSKGHPFYTEKDHSDCQRSFDHIFVGLFLGPVFCSIDLVFYSSVNTTLSLFLELYSNSWSSIGWVLWLCSSLSTPFFYPGYFPFLYIYLELVCWYPQKNFLGL